MVTIMDRTGEQQEFKYDQIVYAFRPGKTTQVIPLEAATFLFRSHNPAFWVHTVDGQFLRRYGVTDAPADWVDEVGMDVLETSPLARNTTRLEGWDSEAVDPERGSATAINLSRTIHRERPGDYENQGASARVRS
jgi:hypothetical protein